ncbi:tyrosine-type recombinase/integrase, partial [Pseudoalteromonas sp. GABNS16H]|uniref:tyrosine-type recombinase/integrase n=1 Tax=Pseudoalteromonas sp. GABNS16H TaxID=3025325 RepID=UPI00235E162B
DIDKIAIKLQEEKPEISVSTINRKYAALSVMIKFAQKRGYIKKMFEMPKYKEPEHRIRWISKEEEVDILNYFNKVKPIVSDIVIVLLDTGIRCSELWRLKVDHVSDTHLTVWVSKGGKARSVPLTSRVRAVFKKHIEGREKEEQVFKDWNNWKLTHFWGRVRAELGLENDAYFVPHILRHTFCTRLVQKAVPLSHVQKLA